MSVLATDFPTPAVERETFAGGFAANGTALLTLDELSAYDSGKGRGAERLYKCPFCGASERAFHVNAQTGRFNCKRASCSVKGVLREFWSEAPKLTGRARAQARLQSAFELAPIGSPTVASFADSKAEPATDNSNWRSQWESALMLDAPTAQAGWVYLAGRGVCLETAIRAGVRFTPNWAPSAEGKSYRGGAAILFPLHNFTGDLQAVNGRYLQPQSNGPKARTGGALGTGAFWAVPCKGFNWRKCDGLSLVEGPFDALALAACGVPSLAVGGVNLPSWIARAVAFKAVGLGADADEAGDKAADNWGNEVSAYTQRVFRLRPLEDCKDFGEALEIFGRDFLTQWLQDEAAQLFPVTAPATASHRPNAFIQVPSASTSSAPGAAKICGALQSFERLFAAARGGELPCTPLDWIAPGGERVTIERPADAVKEIEALWTRCARLIVKEQRDLTASEETALDAAMMLLETLSACFNGKGEMWLDLQSIEAHLDSDLKAMHEKQRAAKRDAQSEAPR